MYIRNGNLVIMNHPSMQWSEKKTCFFFPEIALTSLK